LHGCRVMPLVRIGHAAHRCADLDLQPWREQPLHSLAHGCLV
jgi:hypothetical protein